jgi:hypothetical protein
MNSFLINNLYSFSTTKKYEVETKSCSYFFRSDVNLPPTPRCPAMGLHPAPHALRRSHARRPVALPRSLWSRRRAIRRPPSGPVAARSVALPLVPSPRAPSPTALHRRRPPSSSSRPRALPPHRVTRRTTTPPTACPHTSSPSPHSCRSIDSSPTIGSMRSASTLGLLPPRPIHNASPHADSLSAAALSDPQPLLSPRRRSLARPRHRLPILDPISPPPPSRCRGHTGPHRQIHRCSIS